MNTATGIYNPYQSAIDRVTQHVSEERDADGKRVLVDFTGREINRVSDKYALVQNADIIKPFVDAFGIDKVKRVTQYGGRGKYTHVAIDTGREFSFSYNGERDVIRERLIIENSYNKARSFRFMFGAFRTVCANGMYQGQATLVIRRIHSGRIDIGAIVSGALSSWEANNFDLWRDFQAKPMTLAEEIALVKEFNAFDPGTDEAPNILARRTNSAIKWYSERMVTRPESLDNQRNAWGALNCVNRAIAANLKAPGALPRLISANVAAEAYIKEKTIK